MPSTFTLSKASVTSSAMLMIPAVWITTTEARSAPSNRARRDSGSVTVGEVGLLRGQDQPADAFASFQQNSDNGVAEVTVGAGHDI